MLDHPFREIGGVGKGAPGSATEAFMQKVEEFRTAQVNLGKKCSPQQAFTKVYLDPANKALKEAYDAEDAKRRAAAAA